MNKYLNGVARIIGGAYPARGGQQRDRAAFHIVGISTARFSESRSDRSILAQRVTLARAIADSLIAISTRSPIPGYLHSHRRRLPVRARVGRPRRFARDRWPRLPRHALRNFRDFLPPSGRGSQEGQGQGKIMEVPARNPRVNIASYSGEATPAREQSRGGGRGSARFTRSVRYREARRDLRDLSS